MRLNKNLWVLIVIFFMAACGGPKIMTSYKTDAESFETSGNFVQATEMWKQYFSQVPVDETVGADFANAANAAYKAGNPEQAKSWFDQARYKNYSDAEMYATLAKIYQSEDNLSKELSSLEFYAENFGTSDNEVNSRLFEIYAEIDSNDKALEIWESMNAEAKSTESNLVNYFNVNKALENNEICDSVSKVLLQKNPNNIEALEWNAKKYYWAGQKRYESEMAKYNKKKTRKNYNILLKQLDLVTADFKKAVPYLSKLWKLQPGKEYAGYLANIYARFGDEKKTNYYKNYLK
ncbi:MAG: hypothetical protein ABFS16_04050 [Bacteroidota bacterium]